MKFEKIVLIGFALILAPLAQGQTLEVLHSFQDVPGEGYGPSGTLVQGTDGNFYGTTQYGGISNSIVSGTIFKMTPSGDYTTLHSFTGNNGAFPLGGIVQGSDGLFYGTTYGGGGLAGDFLGGEGTVFKITADGVLTTLAKFDDFVTGAYPIGGLVQGKNGNFYGMTQHGGTKSNLVYGTVFTVTTNGLLTALFNFDSSSFTYATAGLVKGPHQFLYGSKEGGVNGNGNGTIFRMTESGNLKALINFRGLSVAPTARLVLGRDGCFYGTTWGTVFKMTTQGNLTSIASLNPSITSSELVEANDGNFYGTYHNTYAGDVFQVNPNGMVTYYNFFGGDYRFGFNPSSGLIQGKDGNLYGTTLMGGDYGYGTIYRIIMPR